MVSPAMPELVAYICLAGNATELIISIAALANGDILLVQVSLLGSVLSNLLLVLGSSFIAGGLRTKQQRMNQTVVATNMVNTTTTRALFVLCQLIALLLCELITIFVCPFCPGSLLGF